MTKVMLAAAAGGDMMSTIIMLVLFMAIFWFLIIRPQKKKDQQTKEMQNSLGKGDKVTTIGGIVGTVLSVKDDSVVIETGSDKTKLTFKKWAIGAVDAKKAEKKAEVKEESAPEVEAPETTEE